ncbi:MAG: thioredoxin-disulfide reductase [Treponema sp.]|nr:thioredoxin-disulfide reductase [Treponema sp.]MDY5759016.1 thioredoxin-disulfide reductase [Treponema sp.]
MENFETEKFDYVIIGAGCAGLASAQYAARGGLSVLVLDLAGAGGQVLQIADLENYPGVFPAVDGATYMMTMQKQAESFGAKIVQAQVLSIDKTGGSFLVKTKKASYEATCLCIATGAIHRNLEVPGEKELSGRGVSYCATCDGPFFRNKKIVVVGGGDSACSEAIYLSTISGDVSIIHRRDKFRAQQAVIDKMLEAGVKPVYDSVVKSINGQGRVQSVTIENVKTGEQSELSTDAVFIFTGMLPQTDLVEMLPKDPSGYILTDENMETSVPGLFAAGDVRSKPFRQVVTAVSDGAIAAHVASERIRNA